MRTDPGSALNKSAECLMFGSTKATKSPEGQTASPVFQLCFTHKRKCVADNAVGAFSLKLLKVGSWVA